MIAARASARYSFTPAPSGTRWYHTHVTAGRNLKRGTYTGQFGFFYIEPPSEPGDYDQEIFLALKEWESVLVQRRRRRRLNGGRLQFVFRSTTEPSGMANRSA